MKNYVQSGEYLEFTAGANYSSGDLVEIGSLHGVCVTDVVSGDKGSLCMEGVFTLPKQTGASSDACTEFGPVYFKTGKVTGNSDSGANKLVGYSMTAANQAATTVNVRLANFS